MDSVRPHLRRWFAVMAIVLSIAVPALFAGATEDPPAVPAQPQEPLPEEPPAQEPAPQEAPNEAPVQTECEPASEPEPAPAEEPVSVPEDEPVPPSAEVPAPAEAPAVPAGPPVPVPAGTTRVPIPDVWKPVVMPERPIEGTPSRPRDEAPQMQAPDEPKPSASAPCRQAATFKEAWLDKLRRGVFYSVCGSAAWFDHFFGDEHEYDPTQVYGRLSAGMLHEADGDFGERSKFDVNVPLPNLAERVTGFLGRDDPEAFISDSSVDLSAPEAFRAGTDDRSWLAGFGYNPPGKRGQRMSYRLGVKVSSHPYVFGQVRFRYTRYTSRNTAFRLNETLFYRTNDDQFGGTTYLGYDWVPRKGFLARVSAQGIASEDIDGVKWKSYATLYQDLELQSGSPRGLAYQLLANGESGDVKLGEYGFLAIYREQVLRPWLFGEVTLGYSWIKEEQDLAREGGLTVGIVFEILFGDYYDRR